MKNIENKKSGPLAGLKILDFSTLLPGPYATMLLADMGAEVLRIESPNRLDLVRLLPPMDGKQSAAHSYLNRGKRSMALDLKKEGAAELVKALVQEYDIVVEQFRPGVMDRLGVGYEVLKEANPNIVFCAITGYGQTGMYKDRAGHDINYLALSGVASYGGKKDSGPSLQGIQIADVAGGSHHAVMAILAAVVHRQSSGEGQFLDISMTDAAFSLNAMAGAGALISGKAPQVESEYLNGGTFYDYYETSDGRFFSIGGLEPQFIKGLCEALGYPEKTMQGMSQRPEDVAAFKQFLREVIQDKTFDEWHEFFYNKDLCVEPVLDFNEAAEHPHISCRDMIIDVSKQENGSQKQIGYPIKFSATPCAAEYAGVALGAHTDEVLEELKVDQEKVAQLKKNKVFG